MAPNRGQPSRKWFIFFSVIYNFPTRSGRERRDAKKRKEEIQAPLLCQHRWSPPSLVNFHQPMHKVSRSPLCLLKIIRTMEQINPAPLLQVQQIQTAKQNTVGSGCTKNCPMITITPFSPSKEWEDMWLLLTKDRTQSMKNFLEHLSQSTTWKTPNNQMNFGRMQICIIV